MKPESCVIQLEGGSRIKTPWGVDALLKGVSIRFKKEDMDGGSRYRVFLSTEREVYLKDARLIFRHDYDPDDRILANGFQSWSETVEMPVNGRQCPIPAPLRWIYGFNRHGASSFFNPSGRRGRIASHTWTHIRRGKERFLLAGSLNYRSYTILHHNTFRSRMTVQNICEGQALDYQETVFDLLILRGKSAPSYKSYVEQLLKRKPEMSPVTGWTSWYNYYTDISEEIIRENLENFVSLNLPIDIFQIDDGYQTAVGDWLSIKENFPNGMGAVAENIHRAGLKAGIWLAPFACANNSKIFRDHPDWLVTDEKDRPVQAGYVPLWGGAWYALDIYNEEVRYYLEKVFSTVFDTWNYDMVKLDFLYAAAIRPGRGKSRGMIMDEAMTFLRRLCGTKAILGCGIPMGQAAGYVDYCRIGCDVALGWEDQLLRKLQYPERVSTISSLRSTIHRRYLNGEAFVNDPDVIILRKENNELTDREKGTLMAVNAALGGLVFTSDNPGTYDPKTLHTCRALFPHLEKEVLDVIDRDELYRIDFMIGKERFILAVNLSDNNRQLILDQGDYYDNGLLSGREDIFLGGDTYLEPHASRIFRVIPRTLPGLVGTTGHIFPGSEIEFLNVTENEVKVTLKERFVNDGTIIVNTGRAGTFHFEGKEYNTLDEKGKNILKLPYPGKE